MSTSTLDTQTLFDDLAAPAAALVPTPTAPTGRRRPGRPSIPATSLRSRRLATLLTEDEASGVLHCAARQDLTTSDWLRDAAISAISEQKGTRVAGHLTSEEHAELGRRADVAGTSQADMVATAVRFWLQGAGAFPTS